jgi:hypothetical protein
VQLDQDLTYDRESRALYFRAPGQNKGRKYRYRSLVNETSAEVVTVWWAKGGHSVRHHAFVPRFQRIGDDWFLSITPTFVFTRDGYRPHYNSGALIAGSVPDLAVGEKRSDLPALTPPTHRFLLRPSLTRAPPASCWWFPMPALLPSGGVISVGWSR